MSVIFNQQLMKQNMEVQATVQDNLKPWWEKWDKEKNMPLMSEEDFKFLKEFGTLNVSIAGMWAMTKLLKK